eukprot:gene23947-29056_t
MGAAFAPALVQGLGMLLLPESPRSLLQHGHTHKAQEAMVRLRGPRSDWRAELALMEQ